MRPVPIRVRLTAWYSAVLLLALVALGIAIWIMLEQRLIDGVDASLRHRVNGLKTTLEVESARSRDELRVELEEFAREIHEGELMELRDDGGAVLLAFPQGQIQSSRGIHTVSRNGRSYRVLRTSFAFGSHNYEALVASDLESVLALLGDLRRFLLLSVPLVLGLAAIGGYWISRRALAPVDDITRVAKSISVNHLSGRLPVPRTGDEIQRMSETWNEVLERLESAVTRIRQFTADASHELRSPVALIRSTAELALRRERTAAQYQDALHLIQDEAERMTELTECLLTLARADADGIAMAVEPTDLNRVVTSVVAQAATVAAERGIVLRAETNGDTALACANEPAIRRLVTILVDNALKYTGSGGSVVVSTAHTDDGIRLAVDDTGEGISAEAAPHVFERFYRADPARGSGSGVGLGLAIAQTIARAHHSVITVESEPGKGSRFACVLRQTA